MTRATRMSATRALTASQNEWLRVRSYLQEHRYDLALDAAGDYPAERRVAGTPLLAAPGWQPAEPVPLQDIGLAFTAPEITAPVRPVHRAGSPVPRRPSPAPPRARAPRRCCPNGRTGPAIFATRTRCGNWRPRRCSRTAPPTG